ncbi:MAG TPA: hypothetical protein G4O02_16865 [Caldilineae bacterium]|nr:hypothetical protein [Caldilineae bacterium]
MEIERLFGRTRREIGQQREPAGQTRLRRAGYLRTSSDAGFIWLPLGAMMLERVQRLCVGLVSDVQPLVLQLPEQDQEAWLHELIKAEIRSYRQLPQRLSWEARPGVSAILWLEATQDDLETCMNTSWEDWQATWARLNLKAQEIVATPYMKGSARAWGMPCADGPDAWLTCPHCGEAGETGALRPRVSPLPEEPPQEVEEVATPGCTTIQSVADFLGVPTSHTLKAVFYATPQGRIIFAVVRGDLEIDVGKLERAVGASLHPASSEELEAAGIVAGYASPVGLHPREPITVVGDPSIQANINFVAGANRPGYHLRGVRYPRDFEVDILTDLIQAHEGAPCPACGHSLDQTDGLVLIRQERLPVSPDGPTYLDETGRPLPVHIGMAWVDLHRVLVAIAEAHHDERGLILPSIIAPYDAHVVVLNPQNPAVAEAVDQLAEQLEGNGWEVLWDRRSESAGVKFTDADLIGLPWRITVSPRSLKQGGIEIKARAAASSTVVSLDELMDALSGD